MFKRTLIMFLVTVAFLIALLADQVGHISIQQRASQWTPVPKPAADRTAIPRESCSHYNPMRTAFFGDLHVHTSLSNDARGRDMIASVDDAYRFAKGEPISIWPFENLEANQRMLKLDVPLDFAAVTDHAENIGEVVICTSPKLQGYNSDKCKIFRGEQAKDASFSEGTKRMQSLYGWIDRPKEICGPDNQWCRAGLKTAWEINQDFTEQHYDRSSDCRFTTFHGYEYSNNTSLSKVHRNIIYRNDVVPELPVSALEKPNVEDLWESIDSLCNLREGDCEAISIPHNPNASNGRMFTVFYKNESLEEQQYRAERRARLEPIVEIMQVKGESECKADMWNIHGEDELCNFEKIRGTGQQQPNDCEDDFSAGAMAGFGCQSRLDFARYALIEGMIEEKRLGTNPYKFGFVGGTDTHNATPGAVAEATWQGCCAGTDTTPAERLQEGYAFAGKPMSYRNPGGLMGVWAEENSRNSLFTAMQRREVFATSGPRIAPRFFAGYDIPADICENNLVTTGYQSGVTMGGELQQEGNSSPIFVAAAIADSNSQPLQRLQVVKVWFDNNQQYHQAVYDIAGDKNNGATVNLSNCETSGTGHSQLCSTWQDPDFDSHQAAAYYTRVIENPSCRWSWRDCLSMPENLRPAACSDPQLPKVIQERAWGSPIWYKPQTP